MGASKKLKQVIRDKDLLIKEFAQMYNPDSSSENKEQILGNMLSRDNMTYSTVENMLELLGCEIVFRDKKTGKIYD